jgi:UPF0755 protein
MQSGKSILHAFTVPEGQTVVQVFNRLREAPVLEGDLPDEMPPEGALLPETYKFSRGTTRGNPRADGKGADPGARTDLGPPRT